MNLRNDSDSLRAMQQGYSQGEPISAASMRQHTSSPRILVVDDNPEARDILARQLVPRNFAVIQAENGAEALQLIELHHFDLVLLDIMMPDSSGIEVLRAIRKTRSEIDLPIIMISAKDESEGVVESLNVGANDYVAKPVNLAILLARTNAQLWRKRTAEAENQVRRRVAEDAAKLQGQSEALHRSLRDLTAEVSRQDDLSSKWNDVTPSASIESSNQQATRRRRIFKSAKIVFNGRKSVIDCIIWELHDAGALLRVESVSGVPDEFELSTDGKAPLECYVVQRRLSEVLVEFA